MSQIVDPVVYFGNQSQTYGDQYSAKLEGEYHANQYRVKIFLDYLKNYQPKRVLDVGCGTGDPMVEMLRKGFNVIGFDSAEDMVAQAKSVVQAAGYDSNIISQHCMENMADKYSDTFDCITAMGSLYYSQNFDMAMQQVSKLLEKDGCLIASFRNELFSMYSHNEYTLDFMCNNLMPRSLLPNDVFSDIQNKIDEKLFKNKFKTRSIDSDNVYSQFHNPLTIGQLLNKYNLKLDSIKYYHFHPFPPVFKSQYPELFDSIAKQMESPDDWRGLFMASCFVVKAIKI